MAEDELLRCRTLREDSYRKANPSGLIRSLPGIAKVGGPVCLVMLGEVTWFPTAKRFTSFSGLTPTTFQTGDSDHCGTEISKAGPAHLRTQLIASANTARQRWTRNLRRSTSTR
jgi:transposase